MVRPFSLFFTTPHTIPSPVPSVWSWLCYKIVNNWKTTGAAQVARSSYLPGDGGQAAFIYREIHFHWCSWRRVDRLVFHPGDMAFIMRTCKREVATRSPSNTQHCSWWWSKSSVNTKIIIQIFAIRGDKNCPRCLMATEYRICSLTTHDGYFVCDIRSSKVPEIIIWDTFNDFHFRSKFFCRFSGTEKNNPTVDSCLRIMRRSRSRSIEKRRRRSCEIFVDNIPVINDQRSDTMAILNLLLRCLVFPRRDREVTVEPRFGGVIADLGVTLLPLAYNTV